MFFEKEIEQIGNKLIQKAGLEQTTSFSTIAPHSMDDANLFDANRRIIYSIPERNFYEFKSIQHLFWEKFGSGASTFLNVQKIIISHEVGHAKQRNLNKCARQLKEMKCFYTLSKIISLDDLHHHVETYRKLVVEIENEAWERGWKLINEEVDRELFEIIKHHGLETYRYGDYLKTEDEFYQTYQFLTNGNQVDLIGFKTTEEGEVAEVKIMWENEFMLGEIIQTDNGPVWLNEKTKRYRKETKDWEKCFLSEDAAPVILAIQTLKSNLKHNL